MMPTNTLGFAMLSSMNYKYGKSKLMVGFAVGFDVGSNVRYAVDSSNFGYAVGFDVGFEVDSNVGFEVDSDIGFESRF